MDGVRQGSLLGGLVLLLAAQVAGEVLALRLPVPGPVLGMGLLALLLALGGRVPEGLARAARALLGIMALCFIPAGVGVMVYTRQLADAWIPILVALLLSTLLALAVTALVMKLVGRLLRRGTS
jgi:holin-like protein